MTGHSIALVCGDKDYRNCPAIGPLLEPYAGKGRRTWSNGTLVFRPDFRSEAFLASLEDVQNAVWRGGAIYPKDPNRPGAIVVRMASPYVVVASSPKKALGQNRLCPWIHANQRDGYTSHPTVDSHAPQSTHLGHSRAAMRSRKRIGGQGWCYPNLTSTTARTLRSRGGSAWPAYNSPRRMSPSRNKSSAWVGRSWAVITRPAKARHLRSWL